MSEALLISKKHPESLRTAIFVDEGASVWLYLTEPDSLRPTADCWLFNTIPAPTDLSEFQNGPPPATREFSTADAQRKIPDEMHVRIDWADDGESVAVHVEDVLLGFIVSGNSRGFSKYLAHDGPFGQCLDTELFRATFAIP